MDQPPVTRPRRRPRTTIGRVASWLGRDPWWALTLVLVQSALRLAHRWRIVGARSIPLEGAAVLASNHVSPIDPFAIGLATTARLRAIRYLAAAEFFDHPFGGFWLRRIRMIPIHRGLGDRMALDAAVETLRRGELVGIFPEGSIGDGDIVRRGHSGVARLALAAGVPVIPVGLWGTQRRWSRGGIRRGLPLRPWAAIAIGAPIAVDPPAADADRPREKDVLDPEHVRRLTDRVMGGIEEVVAIARAAAGPDVGSH
jgi:1-acyl-sn-glycerol-3-phosphate acyltransferase